MQSTNLQNQRPFTHNYFKSIFAAKFANYILTQSYSPFKLVKTGILVGGMMGFMDPILLT